MADTTKSILNALLTVGFIVVMAGVLGMIGFVVVVVMAYFTIMLFIHHGLLAGSVAIILSFALLFFATHKLIKQIQKG